MTTTDASYEELETYSPEMLTDYFVLKLNSIYEDKYNQDDENLHMLLYDSYALDLYSFVYEDVEDIPLKILERDGVDVDEWMKKTIETAVDCAMTHLISPLK
jgi:hypothetical protein